MTTRRRFLTGAMATLATAAAPVVRAADYPARPVTIISPAAAGGGPDVIARVVADRLTALWRQQVLLLNRPGGGGLIAAQAAATAVPDGYTLYMPLGSTFTVLAQTQQKLPLDFERDIVPVGLVGEQPMIVAVNAKTGIATLSALVAAAKQKPGELLFGGGQGTLPHMTGEWFQQRAGVKLTFVPYPGITKAVQDCIGGTLQVIFESVSPLAGAIQSGLLTPLAVAAAKRLPDYPDLPTVTEALPGIGAFEARGWFPLMAPSGTPDAVVRKVNADLAAAHADPELRAKLAALGTYARPMTPAELAAFIRSEQELWRPIVRQIFVTAQ